MYENLTNWELSQAEKFNSIEEYKEWLAEEKRKQEEFEELDPFCEAESLEMADRLLFQYQDRKSLMYDLEIAEKRKQNQEELIKLIKRKLGKL